LETRTHSQRNIHIYIKVTARFITATITIAYLVLLSLLIVKMSSHLEFIKIGGNWFTRAVMARAQKIKYTRFLRVEVIGEMRP